MGPLRPLVLTTAMGEGLHQELDLAPRKVHMTMNNLGQSHHYHRLRALMLRLAMQDGGRGVQNVVWIRDQLTIWTQHQTT